MRFLRALVNGRPQVGVVLDDGRTAALSGQHASLDGHLGPGLAPLLDLGARILRDPDAEVPIDDLLLLPPVQPTSMRDFMVFEEHILPFWREYKALPGPDVWYEQPIGYFSNTATIRGARDAVEIPGGSREVDFELEVGAIVGQEATSVTADEAEGRFAGFVVLCDWSARDVQRREMTGNLGPFKGKDFATSLGPVLVTPDEIADRRSGTGYDLTMTASVNGRILGQDQWHSAAWAFEELLSFASWNSNVEAGALLGSGTCQGGCINELALRHGADDYAWLRPGDDVTLEVERLGAVQAPIVAASRDAWPHSRTRQSAPAPVTEVAG